MQAFVANLTAAVLFIHAVFGCGWHHAHGEIHQVAHAAKDACCQHQHHHCDHHGDEGIPAPNHPAPCCKHCGVSCVYNLPQKIQIDSQITATWMDLVVIPPTVTTGHVSATDWLLLGDDERATAPPLRLHLLHQHLTI